MDKQYKNPPLYEVVCEVIFTSENWDVLSFSSLYDAVKAEFPKKKTSQDYLLPGGIVMQGENINVEGPVLLKRDRLICKNESENLVIQFSENQFSIHSLPPYVGWTKLKELILKTYTNYVKIVNPTGINRSTLVYRNKINTGDVHSYENFTSVFSLYPYLESEILANKELSSVQMQVELRSKDNKSVLALQQDTLRPDGNLPAPVSLTLTYVCLNAKDLIDKNIYTAWLDEAHDAIDVTFQNAFTQITKEGFNK